jgi:DDE superfamily endonuclease/Transposase
MSPNQNPPANLNPHPKSVLSDSEIMRILTLAHKGLGCTTITREVGRGQTTVSRIMRTHDYNNFNGRQLSRIRKRKTTKHEDRILIRTARAHDDEAFRDIIALSKINVSKTTLRRRLKEVDLFSRIRRQKPALKRRHIRARLHWAIEHVNWTIDDWIRIIWSDECSIILGRKSRRRRCIRKKGHAFKKQHCDGTVKSGKISIMVWACFSGAKVGPMIICDAGNVNADRYLGILEEGVITFIETLLTPPDGADTIEVATDDAFLFMHDNAPCHTAVKVTKYLKQRRIHTMKWPAQSPDLNPIENLWTMFKEAFHKRLVQEGIKPSTRLEVLQRCKDIMKEVWSMQGMELIRKLVESMSRRCAAVIAARGGYTKY